MTTKPLRDLTALFLIFLGLFTAYAMYSYHPQDPTIRGMIQSWQERNPVQEFFDDSSDAVLDFFGLEKDGPEVKSSAGLPGAWLAGDLVRWLGLGALTVPVAMVLLGLGLSLEVFRRSWLRLCGLALLCVCGVTLLASGAQWATFSLGNLKGGGLLGQDLYVRANTLLHPAGALFAWWFLLAASLRLLLGVRIRSLIMFFVDGLKGMLKSRPAAGKKGKVKPVNPVKPAEEAAPTPKSTTTDKDPKPPKAVKPAGENKPPKESKPSKDKEPKEKPAKADKPAKANKLVAEPDPAPAPEPDPAPEESPNPKPEEQPSSEVPGPQLEMLPLPDRDFTLPPSDLLTPADAEGAFSEEDAATVAAALEAKLEEFDIEGHVCGYNIGAVLTMYEYRPAPGVKMSRIAGLRDDLALGLKAASVRIQAPIPGRDVVGVEIPNPQGCMVRLSEVLESEAFRDSESPLTIALGTDIQGDPVIADLADMPHMLVAGATGTGKSVCLNSIILSLIYKADPTEVRLVLVDPKRVELAAYAKLPHLALPVVSDMDKAAEVLNWALSEMDHRYELMAGAGVRNISAYNKQNEAEPLPYLVLIMDELADLMVSADGVEKTIVRLGQLARAAGIHLVLATQRPSVDIVTGLIKANIPCRIAFQTASGHDSRTILDSIGAESLLGRGDMLFKPAGAVARRVQGAFVSDEEVERVVGHWVEE